LLIPLQKQWLEQCRLCGVRHFSSVTPAIFNLHLLASDRRTLAGLSDDCFGLQSQLCFRH
jgi:hypothetical protein